MQTLQGQTAFDVFSYEEVSAEEFLSASPQHILLKAGDSMYAYDRTVLSDYMHQHQSMLPSLFPIYDTPHRQSITHEAATVLMNTAYIIYELHYAYSVESLQKSLYILRCYTAEKWNTGVKGIDYAPPVYDVKPWDINHIREQLVQDIGPEHYAEQIDMIEFALNIVEQMQSYFHIQPRLLQI